jgi:hypothetical protein
MLCFFGSLKVRLRLLIRMYSKLMPIKNDSNAPRKQVSKSDSYSNMNAGVRNRSVINGMFSIRTKEKTELFGE